MAWLKDVNVAQGHEELTICRAASTFAPEGSSVAQVAEASRAVVKSRAATATHPADTQAVVAHCRFMCPSPSFGRSRPRRSISSSSPSGAEGKAADGHRELDDTPRTTRAVCIRRTRAQ
jgi:hypothetical protein